MKQRNRLTLGYVGLITALAVTMLAGCGGEEATSAAASTGGSANYTSAVLDTSYPDALDVSDQLALGTIRLEETSHAVTSEQAAALLPLWQALRGGVTDSVEVNAVLKQIEGTMAPEQLQAIAALQLTQEGLQTWMEEQGRTFGFPMTGDAQGGPGSSGTDPAGVTEEERAALQATAEAGGAPFGGRQGFGDMSDEERAAFQATAEAGGGPFGGRGGFGDMSEEERAAFQATAEAGGGPFGSRGGFGDMSEEEREAMRATAQAGGGFPRAAGGDRGVGGGQSTSLLTPLIQLLQARAGEG
jgi:hypothetical protein